MRLVRSSTLALLAAAPPLSAQSGEQSRLTVERIFASSDFRGGAIPQPAWLKTGSSYIEARPAKDGGSELVKVNIATGAEQTLVTADQLVAQGKRLDVEDLTLSADEHTATRFHDSQQVWRSNTRGLFDIYDFRSGKLTPVSSREGRQMFPMDTVPAHHRIT